jgi:two-component system, sensor histidine kinase and response regulator
VAANGRLALERLVVDSDFDGILMDCQMPEMDGYTATRRIRHDPALTAVARIPIVAMTANALVGDREKVLEAGMDDHIAKPLNVADMFRTLAAWIAPAPHRRPPAAHPSAPPVTEPSARTGTAPLGDLGHVPGLNTAAGLATTLHNESLYRRLLQRFLQSQTDFSAQFEAARRSTDSSAAMRCAHTLKGVAGNIGATAVQAAAGALEQACHDGAPEAVIDAHLHDTLLALTPLVQGLRRALEEPEEAPAPAAAGPSTRRAATLATLQALRHRLAESDSAAEGLLDNLPADALGAEAAPALNAVRRAVADFDFDLALQRLDALLPPQT